MTQMDTDGGPQADEGVEQQLSSIGQQLKEKYVCQRRTRRETDGGPQADYVEERELWRIDRELKEIGPQADGVGEQQLSKIGQQLKENNFAPWMISSPNKSEFCSCLYYQ